MDEDVAVGWEEGGEGSMDEWFDDGVVVGEEDVEGWEGRGEGELGMSAGLLGGGVGGVRGR